MSKELTEKFFNEEDIPGGLYYLKLKTGEVVIDEYPEVINDAYGEFERYGFKDSNIDDIEEVLAPVPEYDQWDRCLKILTIFTKENKTLEASLKRRNRKWSKLVKAIRRINELSVERKKNIKELNDRVKLLESALKYSNSTVKRFLPLIKTAYESRIVEEVEEMLKKTNEVLK